MRWILSNVRRTRAWLRGRSVPHGWRRAPFGRAAPALRFASETGAATVDPAPAATSLATLLTRHILRDGELVLLIAKPSPWFIVFNSLRFAAIVAIVVLASAIFDDRIHYHPVTVLEVGMVLIAGRVMWSVLQWMGRLYVLTDMRALQLTGVFNVEILDCPLRKIARTRLVRTVRERITRCGSIEIIPMDEMYPIQFWQTLRHPRRVIDQINAAIRRSRQGRMLSNE